MEYEEFIEMYQHNQELSQSFKKGFNLGKKYSNSTEKRNRNLETTLKSFIGHDASWLMSDPTYKKLNKEELIRTIKEQRELLKFLFENLDEARQNELKLRVEEAFKSNGIPFWAED
ncbi:hypothetical protein ACIQ1D_22835 [Lysinibacillus xylanilyticus]|uniref:hypothetical protein n=1 Tax=Lysinibacillus xylanilyticus TaxID=582475 RepID=UPI003828BB4D